MQRRFRYALIILTVSLGSSSLLQAGIEIELTDGRALTADRIEWGASSTLILESACQKGIVSSTLSLEQIKRLSIDGSHYDQETIQLASSNRHLIQPATFTSIQNDPRERATSLRHLSEKAPALDFHCRLPRPCTSSRSRGTIIGIHDDPLSAYEPMLNQVYPEGVPTLERGFALELMRSQATQRALGAPPQPQDFPPPPAANPILGKLTQIAVQATPLNTRGKADWNALAIRVQGFDRMGNPARISGNVNITLYGQRQLLLPVWDQQFLAKPIETISLAQWTRNCSTTPRTQTPRVGNAFGAGQLTDQTWIVLLPSPIPEQNPNVYALGEVQVSLVSPGIGTFEASTPAVPLKHVSLTRDLSLANDGSRFFPSETTSSGVYRMKRLNYNAASRPSSRTLSIQP
ncbi:hypothetical protein Pan241w_46130 [Gimesia alba]|uniref:SLA1 homology domain-containing protein n=1 Tax=Gimesia alba TaxID=2527973 RepID=A0A517RKZ8_9PLAN|nr:hypothetical protein [Gimesia alba]QDT44502.1 hypothetical protein Pan241w_46130 [Gimesia alba]